MQPSNEGGNRGAEMRGGGEKNNKKEDAQLQKHFWCARGRILILCRQHVRKSLLPFSELITLGS